MMLARNFLLLSLLLIFVTPVVSSKSCPQYCAVCSVEKAICETDDTDPFPLNLDPETKRLSITYIGEKGFRLNASMVNRYQRLQELALTGNVSSIEAKAFAKQDHLTILTIQQSLIERLHYNVFGNLSNPSNLRILKLNNNRFMRLLPANVFPSLSHLETLDISYNTFQMCHRNDSISSAFEDLRNLKRLNLAGLGDAKQCQDITSDFFKPIRQVKTLNVSASGFFYGDQSILNPLTHLDMLVLSNVFPYSKCPSKVGSLFGNLSKSVRVIVASRWFSSVPPTERCKITMRTLQPLHSLPKLRQLVFKYGNQPFGTTLIRGTFSALHHLQVLQIGYCGIAKIQDGAFDGLSLTSVLLSGNPIGLNQFWVQADHRPMTSVQEVILKQSYLDSIVSTYNASFIVQSFPNVKIISMAKNNLQAFPNFAACGYQLYNKVSLEINENFIGELPAEDMSGLCMAIPNFVKLDLSKNVIRKMEYLCPSLESLNLRDNRLSFHSKINFATIKKLSHLVYLNLQNNMLTTIPSDLFYGMPQLDTLILRYNRLHTLDSTQFSHNQRLYKLDLSENYFSSFNVSVLRNNTILEALKLHINRISIFSKEFVEYAETSPSLRYLVLDSNPIDCSCDQLYFQTWVKRSKNLQRGEQLSCQTPESLALAPIVDYHQPVFDCYIKWVLDAVGGLIGLILLVFVLYRLRWYLAHFKYIRSSVIELKLQDECKYDAMVLFNSKSNDDTNWVKLQLLFELEGGDFPEPINLNRRDERERLIYIRVRDDITGGINYDQCSEVMKQSRKIIIVLSNSFLREPECIAEATHAGCELFSTGTLKPERFLILILEELEQPLVDTVSSLLVETNYIEVFEEKRKNEAKMRQVWKKLKKFVTNRRSSQGNYCCTGQIRSDEYQEI